MKIAKRFLALIGISVMLIGCGKEKVTENGDVIVDEKVTVSANDIAYTYFENLDKESEYYNYYEIPTNYNYIVNGTLDFQFAVNEDGTDYVMPIVLGIDGNVSKTGLIDHTVLNLSMTTTDNFGESSRIMSDKFNIYDTYIQTNEQDDDVYITYTADNKNDIYYYIGGIYKTNYQDVFKYSFINYSTISDHYVNVNGSPCYELMYIGDCSDNVMSSFIDQYLDNKFKDVIDLENIDYSTTTPIDENITQEQVYENLYKYLKSIKPYIKFSITCYINRDTMVLEKIIVDLTNTDLNSIFLALNNTDYEKLSSQFNNLTQINSFRIEIVKDTNEIAQIELPTNAISYQDWANSYNYGNTTLLDGITSLYKNDYDYEQIYGDPIEGIDYPDWHPYSHKHDVITPNNENNVGETTNNAN